MELIEHFLYLSISSLLGLSIRLPFATISMTAPDAFGEYSKILGWSNKKWNDYRILDSVNPGTFPRPSLFHFIISRFPKHSWRIVAVLGNYLSDIATGIWVYVVFYLSSIHLLELAAFEARLGGFLAMLLFLTSPLLFPNLARLKANNNRTLGLLLCTLYFTFIFGVIEMGGIITGVLALLTAYLIILASTFGMQVIIFFSIPLSILYLNILPILIPAVVIGIGWLFPVSGVRSLLIFKKYHTQMYYSQLNSHSIRKRNLFYNIYLIIKFIVNKKFKKSIDLLTNHSPLLILLYSVPILWLIPFLVMNYGLPESTISNSSIWLFCNSMIISSSIIFLGTSIGPGRIFGQAERYFEYSLPMLCVGITVWVFHEIKLANSVLIGFIIFQIALIPLLHLLYNSTSIIRLLSYKKILSIDISEETTEVVDFLKEQPNELKVATLPMKLARLFSSLTLDVEYNRIKYYNHMMLSSESLKDGMSDYFEDNDLVYTYGISPIRLKEKYGINYIIIKNSFCDIYDHKYDHHPFYSSLRNLKIVFDNSEFTIFQY